MHDAASSVNIAHDILSRRTALAGLAAVVGAGALAPLAAAQPARDRRGSQGPGASGIPLPDLRSLGYNQSTGEYVLPPLPYAYDALEPHIDARTMEIHHTKHHQGYVNGLNKAVRELRRIAEGDGDASLTKHWARELAFHGGGHINHTLFWYTMAPEAGRTQREPTGELGPALRETFGSLENFRRVFLAAADAVEGSGWAWLMFDPVSGGLLVTQMEKQQDLYVTGAVPLMGVDVWEHAYYLKYQNRRSDYTKAYWNVVNWAAVDAMYIAARGAASRM